jgi:hypothetical protein
MSATGTHLKGDTAEMIIATEAMKRGYKVSFPFGHDSSYDLIIDRNGALERVQVKSTTSTEDKITCQSRSAGRENGKLVHRNYTSAMIEWLAIYDERECMCYFVPAEDLGSTGKDHVILRLQPTKNGQKKGIMWASDYTNW